jgi:hypothetical protein
VYGRPASSGPTQNVESRLTGPFINRLKADDSAMPQFMKSRMSASQDTTQTALFHLSVQVTSKRGEKFNCTYILL